MRKFSLNQKMRFLQLTHALGFVASFYFINIQWLTVGVFSYAFFETFGGNIGLHRYFGHHSFKTSVFFDRFLCLVGNLVGAGSTLSWVGTHRYHHSHSDKPTDVHSPYYQSYYKILIGDWDVTIPYSTVKDLVRNPMHKFFHKNYFKIHILWALSLLLIDIRCFLFVYCWACFLCLQSGYMLAIWAHKHGYRTYATADQSRNSWLANIYTLGEGWHNNHHMNPNKYRQGELWWEIDLPAFFIKYIFMNK